MLTMNEDLESAIVEYLKLLEAQEYFEAHEVMEEAWHPLRLRKDPIANLAKGLINAAITFEHIKRDRKNLKAKVQKVIASYERHKHLCVEDIRAYALFQKACEEVEALKVVHREILS